MDKTSRIIVRSFLVTGVLLLFLGVAQLVLFLGLDKLGVVEAGNALGYGLLLWIAMVVGTFFLLLGVLLDLLLGQENKSRPRAPGATILRMIALAVNGVMLLGTLGIGALLLYPYFPEYFGHYRFYTTCKSLRPGMTMGEARAAMAPFLEVGRTWQPRDELHAGIMGSTAMGVAETRTEHNSRILFIPDARNISDWCMVYPERGTIARVDFSPD
jgi:hypothetical protein